MHNSSIKKWSSEDQPRNKLIRKGRRYLTDVELLTLIIGKGNKENSAFDLAHQIYESVDGKLDRLAHLPIQHLMQIKGIGEQKAAAIFASLEFGMRRFVQEQTENPIIKSAQHAFHLFQPYFFDLNQEHAFCMCLNRRNEVIQVEPISVGGLTSTIVDPKVVFQKALYHNSCALILAHNHPSGSLKPSEQDIQVTQNILAFGKMIDLPLLDHLIVTDNSYFSFADKGLI